MEKRNKHWSIEKAVAVVSRRAAQLRRTLIAVVESEWPKIAARLSRADLDDLARTGFHRRLGDSWSHGRWGQQIAAGPQLDVEVAQPAVVRDSEPLNVSFVNVYYANAEGAQIPLGEFSTVDLDVCIARLERERDGISGTISFLDDVRREMVRHGVLRVADLPPAILLRLQQGGQDKAA